MISQKCGLYSPWTAWFLPWQELAKPALSPRQGSGEAQRRDSYGMCYANKNSFSKSKVIGWWMLRCKGRLLVFVACNDYYAGWLGVCRQNEKCQNKRFKHPRKHNDRYQLLRNSTLTKHFPLWNFHVELEGDNAGFFFIPSTSVQYWQKWAELNEMK